MRVRLTSKFPNCVEPIFLVWRPQELRVAASKMLVMFSAPDAGVAPVGVQKALFSPSLLSSLRRYSQCSRVLFLLG